MTNQIHYQRSTSQRPPAPVFRNLTKQAMLNFIPLARPRREMADRNRQSQLICQALKNDLPQAHAVTTTAASIGCDEQALGVRIDRGAHLLPPAEDCDPRKFGGIVIDPHADPTLVAGQVIDPLRNDL